jgi:hypothetical protein
LTTTYYTFLGLTEHYNKIHRTATFSATIFSKIRNRTE